jgi:ataxia telangiectasia mutated family protein
MLSADMEQVKGGTDDLRQDSIMEQVFGQVSDLMQTITATRQRNLGIRTYKVIPLSTTAGILEFVKNTVAVHGWLVPAHEKYHPKDWKADACRTAIGRAVKSGQEKRVKVFQEVCQNFKPVLRYFFMERYQDPDEWFAKRTAYTRSTAAISILGHVLGIGDRHGHNILLDEKSGEIVHIDLGVAFEVGRILAVPEVVPFRLTRDIVDGMGITQTEGVFRRCCEFVLDALRQRSDTIMTVLDVLRYDPLYNWTLSPIRLAKLQQNQDNDQDDNPPSMPPTPDEASKAFKKPEVQARIGSEPSEADRALTVVKKKLSKTLSVQATVNDLINQAVDEKNLAVLFSGKPLLSQNIRISY